MPMKSESQAATDAAPRVDLLWTGGWDSTFRVLDIVHRSNAIVQPWYVVDPIRRSAKHEVRTMEDIRARLEAQRPDLASRVLPTVLYPRADIPEMPEVTAHWQAIRARGHIGRQYDWLSRLARHEGLTRLEIGIQGAPDSGWAFTLAENARRVETPYGPVLELIDEPSPPELELFRPFVFPLVSTVKLEMKAEAERAGFAELLHYTWFCSDPRRDRICGRCHPCRQALAQGMAWRMPWTTRIRGALNLRVRSARRAWKSWRRKPRS